MTLSVQQFYKHDFLLKSLADRLKQSQNKIVIVAAIVTSLVIFGGHILAGYRYDLRSLLTGFDLTWVLVSLVIVPLVFMAYLWMPAMIVEIFNSLEVNNMIISKPQSDIETDPDTYKDLLKELAATVSSPWITLVGFAGVVIYWLYTLQVVVPITLTIPFLARRPVWLIVLILVILSPAVYAGVLTLIRMLILITFTNKLFKRFELQINPLHPDGCGGLGSLGRVLAISMLMATFLGATAVGISIAYRSVGLDPLSHLEPLGAAILYVTLTPIILIAWLWTPHNAMLASRNATLQPLAAEFLQTIQQSKTLVKEDIDKIKRSTDKLTEIRRQYELIVDTFPVWPIRLGLLRSLVATASLPFLTSIISVIVDTMFSRFKP